MHLTPELEESVSNPLTRNARCLSARVSGVPPAGRAAARDRG